ncbi:YybH family protein [Limnovirga soli]|uniref:DUF4440 domain-containing protein n=1 Tax=Limnovirga soli TaxID=2656915 RepID=A0A8J8FFD1_9BACT|nr:nuclear transport factor 2 family protein [Limnovirga soli]NNV55349.1 DUF4440 domain-containing protein [Limnovirga soli]
MYKKSLLLIGVFLVAVVTTYAQSADEKAIRYLMHQQIATWNSGNIDAFMETYWKSDSLLFVGSKGPTYGWENTLNNYKKNYPDTAAMGKLRFDILSIKPLSPEYIFVLGKWHLTRTIGNVGGTFTLLFKKIEGKWLIVADHSS